MCWCFLRFFYILQLVLFTELHNSSMKANEMEASLGVRLLTAGTAACIADVATFPFDTAKVRLQLQGEAPKIALRPVTVLMHDGVGALSMNAAAVASPANQPQYRGLFGTLSTICRQEGPRALYNGLSAGLQRQMCFASVRLGMYDTTKLAYQRLLNESPDGLHVTTRVLAGLTTGGLAVAIAQPTDVVKVRFQAQNKATGLRYTSTMQAYRMIGSQEGVRGLWKGALPNIVRNSLVNVSEIVCYDLVKDILIQYTQLKDDISCHFSAAVIAG